MVESISADTARKKRKVDAALRARLIVKSRAGRRRAVARQMDAFHKNNRYEVRRTQELRPGKWLRFRP